MKEFKRKINEDNFVLYRLGENAKDNHQIISDADPEDWWVHIDGLASAHCIIEKIEVDELDLEFASSHIRDNSKYKTQKQRDYCTSVYTPSGFKENIELLNEKIKRLDLEIKLLDNKISQIKNEKEVKKSKAKATPKKCKNEKAKKN